MPNRYFWFTQTNVFDNLVEPMDVPVFSEGLDVVKVTNPIDPRTGFPVSDLSLYFRDDVPDEVKELIARGLQRLGVNSDTSGLSDEALMSVIPSRYTQSFGEIAAWRSTLSDFVQSDYYRNLSVPSDPGPGSSDPAPGSGSSDPAPGSSN